MSTLVETTTRVRRQPRDFSCGDSVVFYAPHDVRIEPMAKRPEPGTGEVLVRVEACAICGTDVKSYRFGNARIQPPQIMGHEFCGTIEECGQDVTEYSPGQRVVMATSMGCGSCFYCKSGHSNICPEIEAMGFHYPGGMAPWLIIPAKGVRQRHLVDVGDLNPVVAALAEPMSCVINNVTRPPRDEVHTALVLGLGPLGFLHAICLRERGVESIVCVEFPGRRFELAQAMGFQVITPEELERSWQQRSGNRGFDFVIVTAPSNAIQGTAPKYARKRGYVSWFASLPAGDEMLTVNSRTVHYGELTVYGTSDSTPEHVRQAVDILRQGQNDFRKIVTHVLPMSQFEFALDEIKNGAAVKIVLVPEN
ncbi:MAG: alcohol dehydrogenase catalytic domain-containing protein [Planctomycetia bacterium]|nr:alcohol dehydrogenase catalytic domain-containing protein [Planctomycetia bacterium]